MANFILKNLVYIKFSFIKYAFSKRFKNKNKISRFDFFLCPTAFLCENKMNTSFFLTKKMLH